MVTMRNPAIKTETINLKNGTELNCLSLVSCSLASWFSWAFGFYFINGHHMKLVKDDFSGVEIRFTPMCTNIIIRST
jgi:putative methionine-R-sulfoxide reductase with GAF domain